jgi:hypothetical protein
MVSVKNHSNQELPMLREKDTCGVEKTHGLPEPEVEALDSSRALT